MANKQLPPDVLAYFTREGRKGGKTSAARMTAKARRERGSLGGRTAAANMTAKKRQDRARKAGLAAALARKKARKAADVSQ